MAHPVGPWPDPPARPALGRRREDGRRSVAGADGASPAPASDPLARLLLTTDGTVSHVVEAFTGEPVAVVLLSQVLERCGRCVPELDLGPHDTVVRRSALLRGASSSAIYLHADSLIAVDALPSAVRDGLMTAERPIGRLLRESRLETFREILASGREPAADRAVHFGVEPCRMLHARTYRIFWRQRPVMRVTERFPASSNDPHTAASPAGA